MNHIIVRAFAATCLLLAMSALAPAQSVKQSPRYKITYVANGWDELTDQYIEKRARKIERKYGSDVASDWRNQARRMREFGSWLDEKWEARVEAWSRCTYVGDVSPRRFFVVVEGDPFRLPQYPELSQVWGTVDTSAKYVRLTAWAFIKSRGWVVNAIDTWEWEAGNALQILKRGLPNDVNREIGSGDPCR